jgi:hypothetical protein
MTEKRITPKDGLDELEYGLLLELRLLKEVGAIAPVLEVMTACMAELYVESERREFERQEEERKRPAHSTPKGKDFQRSIGRTAFQTGYIPLQFKPDNLFIRRLIEEKTASGLVNG